MTSHFPTDLLTEASFCKDLSLFPVKSILCDYLHDPSNGCIPKKSLSNKNLQQSFVSPVKSRFLSRALFPQQRFSPLMSGLLSWCHPQHGRALSFPEITDMPRSSPSMSNLLQKLQCRPDPLYGCAIYFHKFLSMFVAHFYWLLGFYSPRSFISLRFPL